MSYEENQNDEVINTETNVPEVEKLDNADLESYTKFEALSLDDLKDCADELDISLGYRLQLGTHDGSSCNFNMSGNTRFCVNDGVIGTMYIAEDETTAMKEVLQGTDVISPSEFQNYYMGHVVTEKKLKILSIPKLLLRTNITLRDLTSSSRFVTQSFARKVREAGMDGIEYVSNVSSKTCYALWHDDPSGEGLIHTVKQTSLSDLKINSREAADILVFDMKVAIM
jgi:hypothetical protein